MLVADALCVKKGLTAVIGSGGKSTLLLRLARELAPGGRVLLATSTHMFPPPGIPLVTRGVDEVGKAFEATDTVCAGLLCADGKLAAPAFTWEEAARAADYVLIEADGSRGLPLKAHAAHEPVIPPDADVIAVIGASGFGRTASEAVHRPGLYAAALCISETEPVTPEAYARAARLHFPNGKILVNQCDGELETALALRFKLAYGAGIVAAAALRDEEPIKALWRD